VLSSVGAIADRLLLPRALEWSARVRASGSAGDCPLLAIASSPARSGRDRVAAAAVAAVTFADPAARDLLEAATPSVADGDIHPVLTELLVLAPAAADSFVVACATSPERCVRMLPPMVECGAVQEALAVLRYGHELIGEERSAYRELARELLPANIRTALIDAGGTGRDIPDLLGSDAQAA